MEILVFFRTYNSFGGHKIITPIGGFLEMGMPDFGPAFHQMEVYIAFKTTRKPKPSLQSLHEQFQNELPKFSGVTFTRKKKRIELRFVSRATAEELEAHGPRKRNPDTCSFLRMAATELVENLELIRKKIKTEDDFDVAGFVEWSRKKLESLPRNDQELNAFLTRVELHDRQKRAAKDDWQKLGIDFEDFHRNARKILDDPFFWDVADDFSPNGNDTGADLLEMYRDWRKKCRGVPVFRFYKQVLRAWGINPEAGEDDGIDKTTADEAAIGIAFAQIKLEARCEPEILKVALNSLARQKRTALSADDSWTHKQNRLETIDWVEKKLLEIQNLPAPKPRGRKPSRSTTENTDSRTKK